jgi:hypothetical protein
MGIMKCKVVKVSHTAFKQKTVESFMGYMEKSIYGLITNYSLLCRV